MHCARPRRPIHLLTHWSVTPGECRLGTRLSFQGPHWLQPWWFWGPLFSAPGHTHTYMHTVPSVRTHRQHTPPPRAMEIWEVGSNSTSLREENLEFGAGVRFHLCVPPTVPSLAAPPASCAELIRAGTQQPNAHVDGPWKTAASAAPAHLASHRGPCTVV